MQGLVTGGTTKQLTHRPSRLDSEHTACGLRLDDMTHLHLGEGQTCECCAHVVEQVAAALRGEPSWAVVGMTEDHSDANRYHQTLGAKWMCDAIVNWCRTVLRLNRSARAFADDIQSRWQDESFWRPVTPATPKTEG
jgi:hypothetical protein